jgi:hypothetical protein
MTRSVTKQQRYSLPLCAATMSNFRLSGDEENAPGGRG